MTSTEYRLLHRDIDEAVDMIRRKDIRLSPFHTGLFDCLLTVREDLTKTGRKADDGNSMQDNLRAAQLLLSRDALASAIDVLRESDDQHDAGALLLAMASVTNRLEALMRSEAGLRRKRMTQRRRRRLPPRHLPASRSA